MKNKAIWKNRIKEQRIIQDFEQLETDILIIGGGIAGLSVAYFLQNTKQNIYTFVSKGIVYETRKMSEGREEKDGKYKLAELGTCVLSIGAIAASLIKDAKAVKLDKKAKKLMKQSASSEKVNELKAASKQKIKGAKGALITAALLFVASRLIRSANVFDAKKTIKERGFMTDDELELKFLAKKVENQNDKYVVEKPKETAAAETEENNKV